MQSNCIMAESKRNRDMDAKRAAQLIMHTTEEDDEEIYMVAQK